MKWDRSCHLRPTPETDHIDAVLNELEERTVVLSREELEQCMAIGRATNAASQRLENLKVSLRSDEFVHVIGRLGECAVCKYLGIRYMATINTFRQADLPHNIEVRTRTVMNYDLKIRPDDDDARRMVMAIATEIGKPVILIGWIEAREGKRIGRIIDPQGAGKPMCIVPQDSLWPMCELRDIVWNNKS